MNNTEKAASTKSITIGDKISHLEIKVYELNENIHELKEKLDYILIQDYQSDKGQGISVKCNEVAPPTSRLFDALRALEVGVMCANESISRIVHKLNL